jgi:phosphoribosyl 1,2-cyclic phosphodiesterase
VINVLATGSTGNAVIYFEEILVDIGVPYALIKPHQDKLSIVLLTHIHADHINISALAKLCFERPALRVGCGEWMFDKIKDVCKNIDVYEFGKWYDYGRYEIATGGLYHDVPNCFYRIKKNGLKAFHATDTSHLKGITAKEYDYYGIEFNYDEDTVWDIIKKQEAEGRYAHMRRSMNSHLSEQQARQFIYENAKDNSIIIRLHETKTT